MLKCAGKLSTFGAVPTENREAGESPARSRRCNGEGSPEPEDLPNVRTALMLRTMAWCFGFVVIHLSSNVQVIIIF